MKYLKKRTKYYKYFKLFRDQNYNFQIKARNLK